MENVVSKRCAVDGCNTLPSFGMPGERASRCAAHRLDGMEDVVTKRCATHMCTTSATPKYRGHCLRCFIHLFPGETIARRYKVKETHVVDALLAAELSLPDGCNLVLDRIVRGHSACVSGRRPDVLIDLGTHVVIVEVDENQHGGYDNTCENKRLMQLFGDVGERPIVVVRFNPDGYVAAGGRKVRSPFRSHAALDTPVVCSKVEWATRCTALVEVVRRLVAVGIQQGAPDRLVTIDRLFFDGSDRSTGRCNDGTA